jgi:hypothetical protein
MQNVRRGIQRWLSKVRGASLAINRAETGFAGVIPVTSGKKFNEWFRAGAAGLYTIGRLPGSVNQPDAGGASGKRAFTLVGSACKDVKTTRTISSKGQRLNKFCVGNVQATI